jgi:hypothetical protein
MLFSKGSGSGTVEQSCILDMACCDAMRCLFLVANAKITELRMNAEAILRSIDIVTEVSTFR